MKKKYKAKEDDELSEQEIKQLRESRKRSKEKIKTIIF
jgi:hypothetical protein